jgi:hypothetical protein
MKLNTILAVSLALSCGEADAQFSQPPPTKAAPVCTELKQGGSECKDLPDPAYVALHCSYYEIGEHNHGMSCAATAWSHRGGAWSMIDPSVLKYYWASIVDGQEYYAEPMNATPSINVFCGSSRQGYVRVTASWGTAVSAFQCAGYDPPSGQ